MGVGVPQWLVPMPVRVRLGYRTIVLMLVMFVMHMAVIVFQHIVRVFMRVSLRQMQP